MHKAFISSVLGVLREERRGGARDFYITRDLNVELGTYAHREATPTWSKCGRAKETAFTHRQLGQRRQEVTSQLDYIMGPRRRDDDVFFSNDVRLWDTWDHYQKNVRIQEGEETEHFPKRKRKKKWTGWRPKTDEQKIEFKKKECDGGWRRQE